MPKDKDDGDGGRTDKQEARRRVLDSQPSEQRGGPSINDVLTEGGDENVPHVGEEQY